MTTLKHDEPRTSAPAPKEDAESGKVGAAILMWFLGVPGILILLYILLT